jgi:hypothetical protein
MSKKSHDQYWAARQRARYVETCAWWKGIVNRNDLAEIFSISMAQASSDIQTYLERNPTALIYNLRQKRYEATPDMECILGEPRIEDAVNRFMGGDVRDLWSVESAADDCPVALTRTPVRQAKGMVERRAFLAIMNGYRIRMRYLSVATGKDDWRRIRPHALAHDGIRWQVRAWCERADDYQDFCLGRIAEIEWTRDHMDLPHPDLDWDTFTTLKIRPHRDLEPSAKRAVELDHGMTNGVLKIKIRRSMEGYLRARLGLPPAEDAVAGALLECD